MPISHSKKAIFVHIPRTSGTSIEEAFELRTERNQTDRENFFGLLPDDVKEQLGCVSNFYQHLTFAEIVSLIGRQKMQDYIAFSVVRNPWDRLVSCYKNLDNDLMVFAASKGVFLNNLSFRDFVEATETINHVHLKPQNEFIEPSQGRSLDRVFRYEDLPRMHAFLETEFGIGQPLPKLNSTAHSNYREFYDPSLAQRVARRYKIDIDLFKYQF